MRGDWPGAPPRANLPSSAASTPTALGRCRTGIDVQSAQVLIVDDEADVVQALRLRLETAGYRTITALDGAEALDLLRRENVDLILSDLMMPNLDGLELTRRIRQDPKLNGVRILLFSCHDDPASQNLALEFGALDYLSKAIGAPAIISRVEAILGASKPSQAPSPAEQPAYDRAERDLIAVLRALGEVSGPTTSPYENSSKAFLGAPQQGDPERGTAGQLFQLAKALGSHTKARL